MPEVSFDLPAFMSSVRDRLLTATPPPATVGTADSFSDAMLHGAALPAVFLIYKGSRSSGRMVPNSTRQKRDPLKLFLGIVTRDIQNPERAAQAALQTYERVLTDLRWTPATCLVPFVFDGDYFVARDGPKIINGAEFRTKAIDFI